jgi:hypothetical protein
VAVDWVMLEPDYTGPDGSSLWWRGWALDRGQLPVSDGLRADIEEWRLEWERDCYFNDDEWNDDEAAARWRSRGYDLLRRVNEELQRHGFVALPAFDVAPDALVTADLRAQFREERPLSAGQLESILTQLKTRDAAG